MRRREFRYIGLGAITLLCTLLLWLGWAKPSQAHWADLAAAEMVVNDRTVEMTLTYPTGLTPFADTDRSGQLSAAEVQDHRAELQDFLGAKIRLTSGSQLGSLTVKPIDPTRLPPTVQASPSTHSTLALLYSWSQPIQGLHIHYNLFLPGITTSSCLATILQTNLQNSLPSSLLNQPLKTFVFTPQHLDFALTPGLPDLASGGLLLAIGGAFIWGVMHSLSPGHGKTLVGAYLVGSRATPAHALMLAVATTITHTIGVFALGLITLFAARYILPEQLYPWLNLLSGGLIAAIGCNLLIQRWRSLSQRSHVHHNIHDHDHDREYYDEPIHDHEPDHSFDHYFDHHHHSYDHGHTHSHSDLNLTALTADADKAELILEATDGSQLLRRSLALQTRPHSHQSSTDHGYHSHSHSFHTHNSHTHSHLPAYSASITWRSLLALGISGGLVPCPAALVLLLGCISLGNIGLGLGLVLSFSLGLAGVLTGMGLLMVYARRLFQRLPAHVRLMKWLPAASALSITLIGLAISVRSIWQMGAGG